MSFGWELKAKQYDFDQQRLEKMPDAVNMENPIDYGADAVYHINSIMKERGISE